MCKLLTKNILIARAVNGIGTGILNAIVPVWATETAEHTSRGQFIAIEFTLNIFVSNILDCLFSFMAVS
jgi:hypothetical protein